MTWKDKGRLQILYFMLFILLVPVFTTGQININSPYTRFGPGNLVENGLDPRTSALGGMHYGLQRNDLINTANPASYAAFDSASFIFDAGIFGMSVNLRTDQVTDNGNYLSLSHLLFGFPITHWWKASLGIMPFSYTGYDIYDIQKFEGTRVVYNYRGTGGFNQLYLGSGFNLGKHLSIGFNIKYMFGMISRNRGVGFPDSLEMKNTYITGNIRPRDIYGEVGIQYKATLPKQHYLVIGAAVGPQTQIRSKASYIATTYFGLISSSQLYYDTIDFTPDTVGTWTLPWRTGFGVSAGKTGNWMVGLDFLWQNWQKYEYFGQSDSLQNRWTISGGAEYIPNSQSTDSYFQRISYRLGGFYGKTPIELKNHHIDEMGITFGLGFPLKKSRSSINLSATIGRKGTIQDGLIQENFFRFTLGVNVFENWFIKSKYF